MRRSVIQRVKNSPGQCETHLLRLEANACEEVAGVIERHPHTMMRPRKMSIDESLVPRSMAGLRLGSGCAGRRGNRH